ncbi:MAG: hypothetical protein O2887_16695 [Bacteroidetes bacterium]|nr:hypothetical protein [Bacteroidota bacterium]MDA1122100.1 hypothetical protein [Bacteroidota bacterium]
MQNDLQSTFTKRVAHFENEYSIYHREHKSLAAIRIALFLAFVVAGIYAGNIREPFLLFIFIVVFIISFGLILNRHNKIKFKSQSALLLKQLNEEELQRTSGDFKNLKTGDEFFDKNHSYSPDIDIFGSNSLFQLIIRSRLLQTHKLAAKWMLNPTDKATIIERQQAIKELTPKLDWRQQFTSYGMHAEKTQTEDQLKSFGQWMDERNDFVEKTLWKFVNVIMPLFSLTAIAGWLWLEVHYSIVFIPIMINTFLLKVTFKPLLKLTEDFDDAVKSLKMYEHLIISIENNVFESEKLKTLKIRLFNENKPASKVVRSLRRVLNQLENRGNMLYLALNMLFLLDFYWLRQAEKWKRKNGQQAKDWFAVIHEFDLLNDMASFACANPEYTFPEMLEDDFSIKAAELGHPLIRQEMRVNNTFELNGKGFVGVITGSNMSGKSTFLRTVGLNLVMAQMGLPVCAKGFSFSLTRVFTGMRTSDNLEESVSSFYAELARIKTLLDSINNEEPILFLLDEILKGTNSEDRHKGSVSLIQQLNTKNAFGLISTHDLALASLEKGNEQIKNYSFNSTIKGDEILFDYKLTDGPCRSFNASKLMEKMGIIVRHQK